MLSRCSCRHLQSWLVFWLVNTWLLPPAIEGSKSFSYCTWLWRGFWTEFWIGVDIFEVLKFWIFECWSIFMEECFNIWIFEYSRCSTSGLYYCSYNFEIIKKCFWLNPDLRLVYVLHIECLNVETFILRNVSMFEYTGRICQLFYLP